MRCLACTRNANCACYFAITQCSCTHRAAHEKRRVISRGLAVLTSTQGDHVAAMRCRVEHPASAAVLGAKVVTATVPIDVQIHRMNPHFCAQPSSIRAPVTSQTAFVEPMTRRHHGERAACVVASLRVARAIRPEGMISHGLLRDARKASPRIPNAQHASPRSPSRC